MTIDVLKAMGVTQPNAGERRGRVVDGAPFAGMLEKQDRTPQQIAPGRKDAGPPVEEARQVPERRSTAEIRDPQTRGAETRDAEIRDAEIRDHGEVRDSDAQEAEQRPGDGESRTFQASKADKGGRADTQKAATSTDTPLPEPVNPAPEPVNTATHNSISPASTMAPPGEIQIADVAQVTAAPLQTQAEGEESADQAAAPTQVPQPTPTAMAATPLAQALAQPGAAIDLTKVSQGGATATPTITTPDGANANAKGNATASANANANANGSINANGAGAPTPDADPASFTLNGQDQALSASQRDNAVTVWVGGNTASALSLASGPVMSPDTTLAAMSAVEAAPTTKPAEAASLDERDRAADTAEAPAPTPAKAAASNVGTAGTPGTPGTGAFNATAKNAALENATASETKGSANAVSSGPASPQTGATPELALRPGDQPNLSTAASSPGASVHPRFVTPPQPPASQIAAKLAAQAGDGNRSYDIQLDPENLGRVRVHLDVGKDGTVMASISADRADTLAMLRSDARTLQQALQDAGLSSNPGSLDFSLSGQRRDGGASGSGYAGTRQAQFEDSATDPRQADAASLSAVSTERPGRSSRAVDLKV